MSETLLEELKRYVRFTTDDEAALRSIHAVAKPEFQRISDFFYDRILEHDGARAALVGGESVVGRLRHTLVIWMDQLLTGPWDEAYYQLRAKIGRKHVDIALPQHYMFGAMNVLRQEVNRLINRAFAPDPVKVESSKVALGKILDLELAIMLHTYREDLLAQRSRSERLATFGQLVGSIGHELRNPLGVMESSLYILKGRVPPDERTTKHLDRLSEQVGIANHIISDLLDMIRDRPITPEPVAISAVVDAALASLSMKVDAAGLQDLPVVSGDPGQLRQVFVNLLENARQAAGIEGHVTVRAAVEGAQVVVAVEDDGPGISEETRKRLFEPLVTTKQKGIGLGLALVRRIVERHHGTVAHEPGAKGARFVVRLPAAGAP